MENLRIGFIGLGQRGENLLGNVLINFKDVEVVAVCDSYQDRVERAIGIVSKRSGKTAKGYTCADEFFKDENVQIVIISAAWEAHVSLAIQAMRANKITALEVGGAYSVEDCWKLVQTYEQTKTPFMFLENCCYGKIELLATNMVRRGALGEVVYCHGAYCHDCREEICGGVKNRHYRLRNYLARNCENYPTHELGPIAKILNINRGNRLLTLTSLASKARGLAEYVKNKDEYAFLQGKNFAQGDVVCTTITCADGSLITIKLDTSLPRTYSREFMVNGTKGMVSEQDLAAVTDERGFDHEFGMNKTHGTLLNYEEEFLPQIWKEITPEEIEAGHGGMDTLMLRSFFDSVRNGEEMPLDVYDAATWMSISCLSESSIAKGGMPVEIPDFTSGKWIGRKQKDVIDF